MGITNLDLTGRARSAADRALRGTIPRYRARRKYAEEIAYWRSQLRRLRDWYEVGSVDWWGLLPPAPNLRGPITGQPVVDAVMALHRLRPTYLEELRLDADAFAGQRVLEVGCGPLAPVLQFSACERHGLDPLADLYVRSGWPLYAYDVSFVNSRAERMPYPDGWFDAVISVNALDHVDDLDAVAGEIERVVRVGGGVYLEVEYHEPTVTEPIRLSDEAIAGSFRSCSLRKVVERNKRELFDALARRFDLAAAGIPGLNDLDRFATWHGTRTEAPAGPTPASSAPGTRAGAAGG